MKFFYIHLIKTVPNKIQIGNASFRVIKTFSLKHFKCIVPTVHARKAKENVSVSLCKDLNDTP